MIAGCATGPAPVSTQEPEARRDATGNTPAVTAPKIEERNQRDAPAQGLLEEARALRQSGNYEAGFSRLERALRIAPQSADVYLELAKMHQAVGDPARAAASAQRGLLYCEGRQCRDLRRFTTGANR
ncbi:MAG: hypothetical protein Cons2KO_09350 [Congregibacter sp.]